MVLIEYAFFIIWFIWYCIYNALKWKSHENISPCSRQKINANSEPVASWLLICGCESLTSEFQIHLISPTAILIKFFYHNMQPSWPDSSSPPIRMSDSLLVQSQKRAKFQHQPWLNYRTLPVILPVTIRVTWPKQKCIPSKFLWHIITCKLHGWATLGVKTKLCHCTHGSWPVDCDVFYHDVGEISDLSQSEAPNLVMWRVRVMQPTTPSPWRRGRSWPQFNVQENGSMKCH